MPFIEALRLALSAVWSHKLRSFLTLLGVIFGVATVIVVVSLVEGFNRYVDEKIANIGTNAFRVQKFALEDFSALRARGGVIRDAGAKAAQGCDLKYNNNKLYDVIMTATTANMAEI